jgi:hypothetical protein
MDTLIRKMTRAAYDIQQLRIATGLRVVAQFRDRFADGKASEDAEAEDKKRDKLLKEITASYARVTDGIAETARKKNYHFDNVIRDETEVWFIQNYLNVLEQEKNSFKLLEKALGKDAFYNDYLSHVRGIGPAMAGVILSELDPYKAKYPSSFWKYAGLDVVRVRDKETGEEREEGRCRREQHLVEIEYQDAKGETKTKRGLSHNPWLKSKLIAVLGTSFLRANNERYATIYADYKARMMNRPDVQAKAAPKAVAHARAMRYMVKIFLQDLHIAWREHEGLPVSVPYAEAKLGLTHGRDPAAA